MRPVELDLGIVLQIAEEIGKESPFDSIEAKIEGVVSSRTAGHRIRARDHLLAIRRHHGDELAGGKIEALHLGDVEFEMLGALAEMPGALETSGVVLAFDHRSVIVNGGCD